MSVANQFANGGMVDIHHFACLSGISKKASEDNGTARRGKLRRAKEGFLFYPPVPFSLTPSPLLPNFLYTPAPSLARVLARLFDLSALKRKGKYSFLHPEVFYVNTLCNVL